METPFFRYLDTTGDGTGTANAIGDYSGAVEEFKIVPPAYATYTIHRMIVSIEDDGAITADKYGALNALTNGIAVKLKDGEGSDVIDLTDGAPIKSNAEWARMCYDANPSTYGSGVNYVHARWTFTRSGAPITVRGYLGEYLCAQLNDSLVGLTGHWFNVQGTRDE